jgi:hypothetical protein
VLIEERFEGTDQEVEHIAGARARRRQLLATSCCTPAIDPVTERSVLDVELGAPLGGERRGGARSAAARACRGTG